MPSLLADLRYALRSLRAKPAFTLVALLSLTLGIGANTTIFSVANAVFFSELPAGQPQQLARLVRGRHSPLAYEEIEYIRRHATSFDVVMGERLTSGVLSTDDGRAERFEGAFVTGDFFRGMRMRPALGQFFSQRDDEPSPAGPSVVLSHEFWRVRFGGDSSIIGKHVRLNDRQFTIVAVAPEEFTSSTWGWKPSAWIPLSDYETFAKQPLAEWNGSVYVTARMKPGVTLARAGVEMDGLAAQLRQSDSTRFARLNFRVLTARGINEEPRQALTVMMSALMMLVAIVLVIACANVANLLLARATGRRQELGVRLALGANRGRLVQQLLVESFVLAIGGAVLGLASAFALTRAVVAAIPADFPVALSVVPDARVIGFAGATAIVTALVFGLVPALRATRPDLVQSLKDDIGIQGLRRSRLRSSLVVTQVAMGLVLLSSAALFVRGLSNARAMKPGFRDDGVVNLRVDLRPRSYDDQRGFAVHHDLLMRARALPGVQSATLASTILLEGSNSEMPVQRTERASSDRAAWTTASFNAIASSYFETMSIPLVAGRVISEADVVSRAPVAIISKAMAKHLWGNESALGKTFRFGGDTSQAFSVIGIARDVKFYMIGDEGRDVVFFPVSRVYQGDLALQVQTDLPVGVIGPRLEALARELEPALPTARAKAMRDDMTIAYLPARIGAALFGSFGALALVIAMVGIYGVTSYIVAQRTRELGVRAALGAQKRDLVNVGLRDTLRLVSIGVAIGLPLSYGIARGLTALPILYQTKATDPFVLGGAVSALAIVAVLAACVPALRAGRADPLVSLRAR